MNKPIQLNINYAFVDVKRGRKTLSKHINSGGKCWIKIDGLITDQVSNDDGESIEFQVDICALETELI